MIQDYHASYYQKLDDHNVRCTLCPHFCSLSPGKKGICKARINVDGDLIAATYGRLCSVHFDPVEKKPLYHFLPGKEILSIGSIGCNLRCKFCQNWEISQSTPDEFPDMQEVSPDKVVATALSHKNNAGIAYTYNEPIVWYEFMMDTARLAKSRGLRNVMVTNGFINPEPLEEIIPYMDAFSVDLKGFTDEFYTKYTSSKLDPVLNSLLLLKKHGKHIEITNLVITNANDDPETFRDMVSWIEDKLGKDTVLHISRYFPMHEMTNEMTPVSKLREFYRIASAYLNYVYIGNVVEKEGQNTHCGNCKRKVISRMRYYTEVTGLDTDGKCTHCRHQVLTPGFTHSNPMH